MNHTDTDAQGRAVLGMNVLCGALGASTGLMVLSTLVYRVLHERSQPVELGLEALWLAVVGATIAGLVMVAGARPGWPWPMWTAGAMGVTAVLDLATTVLFLGREHVTGLPSSLGMLVSTLSTVASLGARGLLLYVLANLALATRPWAAPLAAVTGAVVGVKALFMLSVSFLVGSFGTDFLQYYGFISSGLGLGVSVAMLVLGLAARSALLEGSVGGAVSALAPGAVSGGVLPPHLAGGPPTEVTQAPASPLMDFLGGAVLLTIGAGVTALSYASASGGGRYVVATGAIAVGLVRIVQGFIKLGRSGGAQKR